jgi:hypothetical protein
VTAHLCLTTLACSYVCTINAVAFRCVKPPCNPRMLSAWDMGPVVGTLWREEKEGVSPEGRRPPVPLGEAELNTVGYVVSRYGALTGKDLENLTHSETPWRTANRLRQPGWRVTIRPEWIRDYFRTDGNPAAGEEEVPPRPKERW